MAHTDDIAYAVRSTQVIRPPREILETFGTTNIRFHLISELMDTDGQVRIRTGRIRSERPQIITPTDLAGQLLQGFGERAREYADELVRHGQLLHILRYGLQFSRNTDSEEQLHESLAEVLPRVVQDVERRNPAYEAVLIGADELWEISLLKFMFDYLQHSAPGNLKAIRQHAAAESTALQREIEVAFAAAARDRSQIGRLAGKLRDNDLFEKYEDRFYQLLR